MVPASAPAVGLASVLTALLGGAGAGAGDGTSVAVSAVAGAGAGASVGLAWVLTASELAPALVYVLALVPV